MTAPGSGPDANQVQSQRTRRHQCRRNYRAERILYARLSLANGDDGEERTPSWVRFALRRPGGRS